MDFLYLEFSLCLAEDMANFFLKAKMSVYYLFNVAEQITLNRCFEVLKICCSEEGNFLAHSI